MSDEPGPLVLDGAEYQLVPPDDLRMSELRDFHRVAGISFEQFFREAGHYHAGAVVAWTAISIHRSKPMMPLDQIVTRLDELTLEEMNEVWAKVEAGQSPPAETSSESDDSKKTSSDDSGQPSEPDQASSGQSDTGDPESDTGPGSLRAISAG